MGVAGGELSTEVGSWLLELVVMGLRCLLTLHAR